MDPSSQTTLERVVLTGFMGAGKSSVGRALAPLLGWRFFDIDTVLSENTGSTVSQFFALHGEPAFRTLEAEQIALTVRERNSVIALGGGALEHAETRSLLDSDRAGLLVYLEAPFALSLMRCSGERGSALRPLLTSNATGADALEQRYRARLPFYRAAHLTVDTSLHSPQEIARLIAKELHRRR